MDTAHHFDTLLSHRDRAIEDGHGGQPNGYVDFAVTLPELPRCDIEGRAEVTVTYAGHRSYFDPVSGAADPGSGPEIEIGTIEVLTGWHRSVPTGRLIYHYGPVTGTPLGNMLDAAIRAKLEADPDWIAKAAEEVRP